MINQKHLQIQIVLLCLLLAVVQFGVLTHSASHPFHVEEESCQILIHCENLGNGLLSKIIQIDVSVSSVQIDGRLSGHFSLPVLINYFSRAPPAIT